jgi:hypothetical protein
MNGNFIVGHGKTWPYRIPVGVPTDRKPRVGVKKRKTLRGRRTIKKL